MTFEELNPSHQLAIEMAARGCVSGTLDEWPALLSALLKLGEPVTLGTSAWDAREISQKYWKV